MKRRNPLAALGGNHRKRNNHKYKLFRHDIFYVFSTTFKE